MAEPWDEGEEAEGSDASEDSERAITQMDPLELRFSQRKMRNVFADGKLIADSVKQVRPIRRTEEEQSIYGAHYRLEAPFPPIEVLRFRCKLRDETTGRPLLDPVTKKEMFEKEESWFTLDNRRLYCLQRIAVNLLPERCTVDTIAEIRKERRLREIRKFRTLDGGRSINVGSVVDGVPFETWSWAEEAKTLAENPDHQRQEQVAKPSKGGGKGKGKDGKDGKGKRKDGEGKGKGSKGGKGGKDRGKESAEWIEPAPKGKKGYGYKGGEAHGSSYKGWAQWSWQEPWAYMDNYWDYGSPYDYSDYGYQKGKSHGSRKGKEIWW